MLRMHVRTPRPWDWDKEGKLRPFPRSAGGQRRYARAGGLAVWGEGDAGGEKAAAICARVSTAMQALGLPEYAAVNGYRVVLQAVDVASGLKARRQGSRRGVEAARRHEVHFLTRGGSGSAGALWVSV